MRHRQDRLVLSGGRRELGIILRRRIQWWRVAQRSWAMSATYACLVAAVGCADPKLVAGTLLRRDDDTATLTCNTTTTTTITSQTGGSAGRAATPAVPSVTLRCVAGKWQGLAAFNCSTNAAAADTDGSSSSVTHDDRPAVTFPAARTAAAHRYTTQPPPTTDRSSRGDSSSR